MTTSPVILNDTILSNGSMAVLAGDPFKSVQSSLTYYGFTNLQVAIISANNSPVTLNQSSGNLSFASAGDSPNGSTANVSGSDESTGGGTLQGLSNGDIAVVTWGNANHNYDLQILNSSGSVVTAPFVVANDLAGPSPSQGNPHAVIASNGSELVVAWSTDDITGLYYERFSLTGTPIGGVVTVKTPSANNPNFGNNNSGFGNSLAIDDQGNVILGFSAEDVYHTGYYKMYNSSNAVVTTTTSQLISTSGVGGNSVTLKNEDLAPQFVPVAGGGFLTAGYVPNGARNSNGTYTNFGLYVQQVATNGSISTPSTTANVLPGGFQEPSFGVFVGLSNGDLAFEEQGVTTADTYDPSTTTLTRNTLTVPTGADNGTPNGLPASYFFVPTPIANVSGGGIAALSVNSSNQLVATGLNAASAPVVTAGGTATFDGGGSAQLLDSGLTVADTGSSTLASATVSITGFVAGDTLSVGTAGGLTVSYNSGTGVLTLSGSAALATYQTALDSVSYSFSPSNGDPTGGGSGTSRTITWSVNDGTTSGSATSSLTVVHEPPVVVAGASINFEAGAAATAADSGLSVSDPDSAGNLTGATVTITPGSFHAGDILSFTNTAQITGVYNSGTGALTLSGTTTVANYQTALDSIAFSTTNNTAGSRTINWTVNDGSTSNGTATGTSTVVVTAGPSVTAGGTATFDGGGSAQLLDSALTLSDPSNTNLSSATVSIVAPVTGDTLSVGTAGGLTVAYNSGTGVLTLSGSASLATYQTALDSVSYSFSPANGDPTGGGSHTSRTIDWAVSDGAATSATATSSLTVVHEPPVVVAGASINFEAGSPAAAADSGLTVSDPDSAGNLTGATVTITPGSFHAGDILSFTNTAQITGVYNSGTGALTLSGTTTVANYQTALDSVAFSTTNNTAGSRTINWTVNDGSTSNGTATGTSTVVVTAGPSVTAGATTTFDGGSGPLLLDSALSVSDPSNANLSSATVAIVGFITGDTLNFSTQNGITGVYNSGTLTLTGTASLAHYQTALDSITYSFSPSNGDPTGGGSHTSRTINWSVSDGTATSATATSTLTVVHEPPVVAGGGTSSYTEQSPAVAVDAGVTVSDPDSLNLVSATATISGLQSGDTLNFVNTANITGSYNSGTGVLTLTGSDTPANYQAALRSVTFSNPSNQDPTAGGADITRTVTWQVNDGNSANNLSNQPISTIDITAINNAPVAHVPATRYFATQTSLSLQGTGLSVSDVDGSSGSETVTLSVTEGFITVAAGTTGITGLANNGSGSVVFSGTLTQLNALLAGNNAGTITYSDNTPTPSVNTTLTLSVNDNAHTGGGPLTGTATQTITPPITVAFFEANQATLDQIPGGFPVTDIAANIGSFAGLAALTADASHITGITATDTPVVVGFGRFSPDEAALNKIVGGFSFDGQALAIQTNIDAIAADAAHINSITAENGTVTVPVATFQNDATALNKIVGGFAISDTAANIFNGLTALEADASHITAITATDTPVVVGAGKFTPDETILNKIAGGFNVSGLAANIGAIFDTFETDIAHIGSVSFADASTPVLNLTQTQATNDASLLAKITSSYVENVNNAGVTTTTGHGNGLTITGVAGGNDNITGGGTSEGFVFGAGFGVDTIVDFSTHTATDTITLSAAEFTNFTTMFNNDTTFSGGNAIIQSGGDQLTIDNMTSSTLQGAQANFHFV